MKVLSKRLEVLEARHSGNPAGRIDTDALTDDELDLLEAVILKLDGGLSIESLADGELRFVASLPVIA